MGQEERRIVEQLKIEVAEGMAEVARMPKLRQFSSVAESRAYFDKRDEAVARLAGTQVLLARAKRQLSKLNQERDMEGRSHNLLFSETLRKIVAECDLGNGMAGHSVVISKLNRIKVLSGDALGWMDGYARRRHD
jgi:uncharacterized protein YicC (UPF0701 family)